MPRTRVAGPEVGGAHRLEVVAGVVHPVVAPRHIRLCGSVVGGVAPVGP